MMNFDDKKRRVNKVDGVDLKIQGREEYSAWDDFQGSWWSRSLPHVRIYKE